MRAEDAAARRRRGARAGAARGVGGRRCRDDHRGGARGRRQGAGGARGALRGRRDARLRARAAAEGRRRRPGDRARRPRVDVRAGLEIAIANVRAVAEAGLDADRTVTLPEGQTVTLREVPVRRAAIYAPSGRHPYPSSVVMGAITARAAGRRGGLRRRRAASDDPRRREAVRGRRRLPHDRRAGDRRARLRHRDDPAGRRDRRPGQPVGAGGQAPGRGRRRDRRVRRPERPDA